MLRRWNRIVAVAGVVFAALTTVFGQGGEDSGMLAALKAKLEASEFEFSRAESDVPFLPLAGITVAAYGKTEFMPAGGEGGTVDYRSSYVGAYSTVPLYIGRSGFGVAVPYVSHTRFDSLSDGHEDQEVDSFYLPLAAIWQVESGNQWGGFIMPSVNSPISGEGEWAEDFMGGALGRHFSGDKAMWYYGLVYDYSFGANYMYPYLGYTYQPERQWVISLVMPWPAVSYAPSDQFVVTAGVMPSGANWAMHPEGESSQVTGSFGGWDLGARCGWRLTNVLWFSAGAGFSGLRSLQVEENGELVFEQNLSREPFVSLTLSIRPN